MVEPEQQLAVEEPCHATREGTLKRYISKVLNAKEKRMTKDFVDSLVPHLDKYVEKYVLAAADEAEAAGKKGVTKENLRAAMEKHGIEL